MNSNCTWITFSHSQVLLQSEPPSFQSHPMLILFVPKLTPTLQVFQPTNLSGSLFSTCLPAPWDFSKFYLFHLHKSHHPLLMLGREYNSSSMPFCPEVLTLVSKISSQKRAKCLLCRNIPESKKGNRSPFSSEQRRNVLKCCTTSVGSGNVLTYPSSL